jgi:transposase
VSESDRIRELEDAVRQRDQRIADLERRLEELAKDLEAWKRGHRVRPGGKSAQKPTRKAQGKNPGRAKGHPGSSRAAPTHVDRVVDVPAPTCCPDCGGALELLDDEPGEQRVEELVPARVEVVAYRRRKARCTACDLVVTAPLPEGLGPNPKLGVRAQAEVVAAKTEMGLSLGQTQTLLARQGLTVSRGGLQQILHRSARVLSPAKEQLRVRLQSSAVAWADETPHRVQGQSGYLWCAMFPGGVLYQADRSRGQHVAQQLLQGFRGTLHSDFYSVYWTLDGIEHAVCWAHLCRSARQVAERAVQPERAQQFHRRLSALYARGVASQKRPATALRNARAIQGDLKRLAQDAELGADADVARLQRRICKHLKALVRFITCPELEATNNRIERELRPHAQARHRSGGARSDHGAQTYATNLSVARTLRLQAQPFLPLFRAARTAYFLDTHFPALFPPATPTATSGSLS